MRNVSTGSKSRLFTRFMKIPKRRLQRFFEFLTNFGVMVKGTGNKVHPRALQEIVESIEGLPEETVFRRCS